MLLRISKAILKVFACALGAFMLAGCGIELPHAPELGYNWVSREGKSQDQLYHDQTECRRDMTLLYPVDSSGPGDHGWGMGDARAFDACMRSKGWTKE
ncbi:MAG: hypothetical protein ABSE08_13730 [Syntrophobacteraceae bacterium]|jgi:hypothetical protein